MGESFWAQEVTQKTEFTRNLPLSARIVLILHSLKTKTIPTMDFHSDCAFLKLLHKFLRQFTSCLASSEGST